MFVSKRDRAVNLIDLVATKGAYKTHERNLPDFPALIVGIFFLTMNYCLYKKQLLDFQPPLCEQIFFFFQLR